MQIRCGETGRLALCFTHHAACAIVAFLHFVRLSAALSMMTFHSQSAVHQASGDRPQATGIRQQASGIVR